MATPYTYVQLSSSVPETYECCPQDVKRDQIICANMFSFGYVADVSNAGVRYYGLEPVGVRTYQICKNKDPRALLYDDDTINIVANARAF